MILLTGATGNIGTELVKLLVAKGASLRVVSRDEKKVAQLDPRIERIIGDLHDPSVVQRALQGIGKLFMIPVLLDPDHEADRLLINEAKQAGVGHIVMISSGAVHLGANNPIGVLHREKEVFIEETGVPWTFLRPGGFMSNTLRWWVDSIKSQAKVFNPTAVGKTAPISPYDIAGVAAVALTTTGHEGKAYDLTGPELLSTDDQVRILSKVVGKPIQCIDIPVEVAAERMRSNGLPEALIQSLSDLWIQVRKNEGSFQTNEVERLTGKPAQTFETWCHQHREAFL
jgi:(4-alkanoyl-5-oxo-2,5-dihydrofuran-3-yl)methyl phosphate reductase